MERQSEQHPVDIGVGSRAVSVRGNMSFDLREAASKGEVFGFESKRTSTDTDASAP